MRKLPEPAALLKDKTYWTVEIFWRFLEKADDLAFENPTAALKLVKHAPALAKLAAPELPLLPLHAYAVLGSIYRALADYPRSEAAFIKAFTYGDQLPPIETVDVKRRLAYLRLDQRRFTEAEVLITEAIAIFRSDGDLTNRQALGRCYLTLGNIYHEQGTNERSAIAILTSLSHLDIKRDFQDYYGALHNLAVAMASCRSPEYLGQALSLLGKARRLLPRKQHLARFKIRWMKALISIRLGSTRHAERELLAVLDGLIKLGVAYEAALVALDLALLYLDQMESPAVITKLARDIYDFFSKHSSDAEALAALQIWRDAERVSASLLKTVRIRILERTVPAMPGK